MLGAVWQGILTGLVLATFVGPIFFAVVDLGLKGNVKGAAYLSLGCFLSDVLWVLFIYFIAIQVPRDSFLLQVMYIVGGSILAVIGLQNLLKAKVVETHLDVSRKKVWTWFGKGFLINSTNPNIFFFWFGAIMAATHKYQDQRQLVLVHFLAALLVTVTTDFLKGFGASLLRPYIKGNTLLYLSRFSGLVLIYFGLKLILFH
jgi:threonine/homoserine/homoserine lactone efflux protein